MDLLDELGPLALGSRLKRMADRLQAEASLLLKHMDYDLPPSSFPVLACLAKRSSVGVVEASKYIGCTQPAITRIIGILEDKKLIEIIVPKQDSRQKIVKLSKKGRRLVEHMKDHFWPAVDLAANDLCKIGGQDFLGSIRNIEQALDKKSLRERTMEKMNERA